MRSSFGAGESHAKAGAGAGKATPEAASPPATGGSALPEAADAAELVAKLDVELDLSRGKDLEWRRRNFKGLLLKWHPDKNLGGNPEVSTEVFRHLMARRAGYLMA